MPSADVCSAPASANLEQEWTFVAPKKNSNGRQRRPQLPQDVGDINGQSGMRRDESTVRSPEEITAEYRRVRSQYEPDAACAALKQLVRDIEDKPIHRAVCLGIGTFDPPDGGWETKRRTFLQLTAFVVMVEILEEQKLEGTGCIECIFQEPLFTKSDTAFLESLSPNFKVFDSPKGFDAVDSKTFLYGVHLYRPIYAKALENAAPLVFVGTSLDIWDTVTFGQATEFLSNENVKTIEKTYRKCEFPPGDTTAFSSTSIYWSEGEENFQKSPGSGAEDISDLKSRLQAASINQANDPPPKTEAAP